MKYASGKNAWGRCGKCGDRHKLLELVEDKQTPNLKVCTTCFDIKHPAEKRFDPTDAVALRKPAPDIDDDSPGDSGTDLATAMGFDTYFGGQT